LAALRSHVATVVPFHEPYDALNRDNISNLQKYLIANRILIKNTDKNLGVAVVRKDWYRKMCLTHLESDVFSAIETFEDARNQTFIATAALADIMGADCWSRQEVKFLGDGMMLTDIPRFHGIPKIHKKPWGLRPIVPSHSWVSSPAAKIISKSLKPLYKFFPWIIQSTGELVAKIKGLKINPDRKLFLCTGDVTAMYTNIDRALSTATIGKLYDKLQLPKGKIIALQRAIILANNSTIVEFDGRYFHQEKGLAMGTA
jgi:hypothetical protein